MIPEVPPEPSHGLWTHPNQTRGPLRRDALGEMFGHGDGLTLFYFCVEKGGSLALGELAGAGATAQVVDL